jgi:uncharacterized membrane protein YphA (DoxX/SURF4 family)
MNAPLPDRSRATALGLLVLLCRLAAGITFLYASLDKIGDPAGFARVVANYRLLPLPLLHVFALLLPWTEAVVGVALILGVAARGAALLASLMTTMFIGAIALALLRGLDISCGCFHTDGGHAVGLSLLWRDLLLLAACLLPLRLAHDGWALSRLRRRPRKMA